jgi:serine/threonine-protein kinase HipA
MRQADIYRKGVFAGVLTEDGGEYHFCYDDVYLMRDDAQPVSLTFPLQSEAFVSPVLFPFFDGLIPEGWLLDIALRNTDISILDRMSLLLLCCKECIGSVSVVSRQNIGDEV